MSRMDQTVAAQKPSAITKLPKVPLMRRRPITADTAKKRTTRTKMRQDNHHPARSESMVRKPKGSMIAVVTTLAFWSIGAVDVNVCALCYPRWSTPEPIGTLPERRGRHLVRTQFDVVHGWSKERAHQLLVISGIPWFYRQFGYELAIERGGGPRVPRDAIVPPPQRPAGWRVRGATVEDAPFLAEAYAIAAARSLVSVPRDAAAWRHEL